MIEVKLIGADLVNKALRTVPAKAHDAIRDEMKGRDGLGVEWKIAVSKTFVGRYPGATLRGQKWIYSKKDAADKSGLYHKIVPGSLDTLKMIVGAKAGAALQELGGTVTAEDGGEVLVPIHDARLPGRRNRRLRWQDLMHPVRVITKSGRVLIGEPVDEAVLSGQQEGEADTGKLRFLFELKRQVRHPGGRLKFRATTERMRGRAVQRFDRALRRVVREFERVA